MKSFSACASISPSGRKGVSMIGERHSTCRSTTTKRADRTFALPLQDHLGEEQMRGRAADVDADRLELDVFLAPDEGSELGTLLFRHRCAKMLVIELGVVHFVVFIIHCAPI